MPIGDIFLNVLAVLGIIAIGAFFIVFISDLLISVIDNSNGIFFKRSGKSSNPTATNSSRPKLLPHSKESYDALTYDDRAEHSHSSYSYNEIDYAKAQEEEDFVRGLSRKEQDDVKTERQRLIEARKQEYEAAAKKITETQINEIQEEIEDEEDFDIDQIIAEVNEEDLKQLEKEAKNEKINISSIDDFVATAHDSVDPRLLEANRELNERVVQLTRQLAAEQATNKDLEYRLSNTPVVTKTVSIVGGSVEELTDRLAMLQKRLKEYERELAKNKKDFLPLKRVNSTLENDKKKLRRREAIVAKQKVILYGVNNYVDIDEDKAKKLAEDLDLLEGLRLSVAHCEEVMNQNKERYPILERANKILTKNVEDIKSDITAIEQALRESKKN
jgi:hypothetical protein